MIGAERLAATVAVELVATGAEHLAACGIGAGANFQEGIAAVFVVFDRKALEKGIARDRRRKRNCVSRLDSSLLSVAGKEEI